MLKRFLGGVAAVLGAVGAAHAQAPAAPSPRPAFAPARTTFTPSPAARTPAAPVASGVMQAKGDGAVPPAPVVAAPAPVVAAPAAAPAAQPTGCDPALAPYMKDAGCGDDTCGACDCLCGPKGRIWVGAEYLLWTSKGNNYPPLATSAPAGTARAVAGTIGGPGTQTLIGGRQNDDWRSGFRIYGGLWLDEAQIRGIEGSYFFLGKSRHTDVAGSDGTNIVTRPFTNNVTRNADGTFTPTTPFQDTELVSFPNVLAGQVAVTSTSDFQGAGVNYVRNLTCNSCGRLDLLLGYRYLNLNDNLYIREDLTGLAGSANPGATFVVEDRFHTENHFHGGLIGLNYERRFADRFFVGVRGSVALGVNRAIVDIDGATTITPAGGAPTRFAGGLLTQPSNIGRYERDTFAVVPEVGVKVGANVTDHLRVYAGYDFIYWSSVTRPGDVIDTRVNASQIPPRANPVGDQFPRYEPRSSDYWVHGVSFGAEYRFR